MLTEETVSKFYEDLKSLGLKQPVAAISKATGYSKGNVSMYLSRKDEPSENFIKAFYKEFGESFKKVPHGTLPEAAPAVDIVLNGLENADNPTLLRILDNLSAAHREISESNNKLSDNQKMILSKLPTNSNEDQENLLGAYATINGVREFVIGLYAEVKNTTPHEAEAALGKKVIDARMKIEKKDSVVDAHKTSSE